MKIQRGHLTEKSGSWLGHYNRWVVNPATGIKRRKQLAQVLGPTSGMTKTKAREALQKLIVKELGMTGDSRMTLDGFIQQRWKPLREGTWRESTKATNEELLKVITDRLGNEALEDVDSVVLQTWLNSLAKTRSGSAVKHIRIFLRSIFAEALIQKYLDSDPARLLKVPKLRAVRRPYLSLAEIKALLNAAKWIPRERALLRLILVTALRPSELLALRWRDLDLVKGTLTLTETVYRGKIRPFTKTTEQGEVQRLVIPEQAIQAMTEWYAHAQEFTKFSGDDDFIFPNASGGFWLKENYQRRVLTPLAEQAQVPHVNFQILRRTVATHAQHLGSPKDIATILRHKKIETSQEHYIQAIEETVRTTGDKIAEVMYQQ